MKYSPIKHTFWWLDILIILHLLSLIIKRKENKSWIIRIVSILDTQRSWQTAFYTGNSETCFFLLFNKKNAFSQSDASFFSSREHINITEQENLLITSMPLMILRNSSNLLRTYTQGNLNWGWRIKKHMSHFLTFTSLLKIIFWYISCLKKEINFHFS